MCLYYFVDVRKEIRERSMPRQDKMFSIKTDMMNHMVSLGNYHIKRAMEEKGSPSFCS